MTNEIARKHQRELIGSTYTIALTAHQHGLPFELFIKWGQEVAKALGGEKKVPTWLARDLDFQLLSNWISNLLDAIKGGKAAIFESRGRLLRHWTIEGFTSEIRAQRQRWSQQLMQKITTIMRAGEEAGAGVYLMNRWEKEMKERFFSSDELFSESADARSLDSSIKSYQDFYKVKSALNRLLVEIEEEYEKGGKKAVTTLIASRQFSPEEIHCRLISKPVHSVDDFTNLSMLPPPPPPKRRQSPLSEFTVLGRS